MAWRSSGTTNDEMVDNLKRFGVVSSFVVEQGFREVDRQFFVPKGREDVAHTDQPLKEGNVHISAPHIYGSALEAMELTPNSPFSFLNVGSGTGYLSCIVAEILGPKSNIFGIEIHKDVVAHSRASISKWKAARSANTSSTPFPHIEMIHGNALNLSPDRGESSVGFDRIYIGAAVDRESLASFTQLLRPGGILVGPVEDELVKVVRIGPIADLKESSDANNFTQQVLSGVRFAPLLSFPVLETIIPARIWSPVIHPSYPNSFQQSSKALLLCSSSSVLQPFPTPPNLEERTNLAAKLPPVLWIEILSFTHRNWFEPRHQEAALLHKRLLEEQANAQKAHQARLEAEARCQMLERERDVYRLMARRWQARLSLLLEQRRGAGGGEDGDRLDLDGPETAAIFGLGTMLRRLQDSDDEEDEDDDIMEHHANHHETMEEEAHDGENEIMEAESDDESEESGMEEATAMDHEEYEASATKALISRPRTVSTCMSSGSL